MLIKCHFSKGKIIRVQFLWPNEDPVREMTICHPPQREEKDPRPLIYPKTSTPVARCFKEFFSYFLVKFIFSSQTFQPTVFTKP